MSDSAPSLETLERPSPLFKHLAKVKPSHHSNAGFEVVFELSRPIFDWPMQRHVLKLDRQKLQVCSRVQRKPAAQGQTGNAEGYRQPPGGSTRRKKEPRKNPMKSSVFYNPDYLWTASSCFWHAAHARVVHSLVSQVGTECDFRRLSQSIPLWKCVLRLLPERFFATQTQC